MSLSLIEIITIINFADWTAIHRAQQLSQARLNLRFRFLSVFLDEPACILYSYHIPAIEMATKSISSNITSDTVTPAADSSTKQRGSVPKRRMSKHMIYGFAFSTDELEEWGTSKIGRTLTCGSPNNDM